MKLRLTRTIIFPVKEQFAAYREISKGSVGEIVGMIWDEEGRVIDMEMAFYGHPRTYTVSTSDLEPW